MSTACVDQGSRGRLWVTWLRDEDVVPGTLEGLLAEVIGPTGCARIVHACRSCGSDRHGKPHVVGPPGSSSGPAFISWSRSGGRVVVAVTDVASIGIDVEARADDDHADDDLRIWVRAESLLKATGHGLTVDPATIEGAHRTIDLEAPHGFVAAVSILAGELPAIASVTSD